MTMGAFVERGAQHPESVVVEELRRAECLGLLASSRFGRLAVIGLDGAPDLFPVNHLFGDGCLYLRSAPGTKLAAIHEHPAVAYEAASRELAGAQGRQGEGGVTT